MTTPKRPPWWEYVLAALMVCLVVAGLVCLVLAFPTR